MPAFNGTCQFTQLTAKPYGVTSLFLIKGNSVEKSIAVGHEQPILRAAECRWVPPANKEINFIHLGWKGNLGRRNSMSKGHSSHVCPSCLLCGLGGDVSIPYQITGHKAEKGENKARGIGRTRSQMIFLCHATKFRVHSVFIIMIPT